MKRVAILIALIALSLTVPANLAHASNDFSVVPSVFDPHGTHLVVAEWEGGIGCPTNATIVPFAPPDFSTLGPPQPYTDPACPTGDPNDKRNEGLLLVKTGPTNDDAAAGAELLGVKGMTVGEVGYDIRKPGFRVDPITGIHIPVDQGDPRGSHCGAGAPRFNIVIDGQPNDFYFIGCNSPPPDMDTPGNGWQRLRWGGTAPLMAYKNGTVLTNISGAKVDSIEIIFDEGDDTGPDNFGLAVLDNIDVNGTLVGKGPEENENKDEDRAQGDDGKGDSVQSEDSPSRPESSSMSYEDKSQGMKMQSVNGARSVSYSGPCVSFAGDAVMNGNTGYLYTFEACSVSVLGTGIGTFSMTVTGPAGYLYQKRAALISGFVSIHSLL